MNEPIIIGTRGSALALWQAEFVKHQLEKRFSSADIRLKIIKTTGDKILDSPLSHIGDKGLFTKEIEHALLTHTIDIAVHSLKDLPTRTPDGLVIAAVTKREDVRDILISKKWKSVEELPDDAVVATGSLRRKSQLLHLNPHLRIVDIRGSVPSRMKKFDESAWDGIILAYAGIKRLGLGHRVAQIIPTEIILPAVGQGALGIEIRENDTRTLNAVRSLNHASTYHCTIAERSLLRTLEGGCQIPIGAYAQVKNQKIILNAVVGTIDGTLLLDARGSSALSRAEKLGQRIGRKLLENGAKEILEEIRIHG